LHLYLAEEGSESVKILLTVAVLLTANSIVVAGNSDSPLSRHVSHFSIGKTSMLDALIWLGRDERICFGIEFYGPELSNPVQIEMDNATISEIVEKILGSTNTYQLSVSDGVILIRKRGVKPPDWLNHRLPHFRVPRGELMSVDFQLWMAVEIDLDPSKQGFGGDYPPTDPIDEVGPFDERGQTVRQLLVRIVAASRGATWYPTQGAGGPAPASINGFWTLVTYSGNAGNRPR
jgi:hypothetical protein